MTNNRTILFLLGIASTTLGPLTGVPGIIIGRRMADRGVFGEVGYFLCWLFSVLFGIAFIVGFIAALTIPLWKP